MDREINMNLLTIQFTDYLDKKYRLAVRLAFFIYKQSQFILAIKPFSVAHNIYDTF